MICWRCEMSWVIKRNCEDYSKPKIVMPFGIKSLASFHLVWFSFKMLLVVRCSQGLIFLGCDFPLVILCHSFIKPGTFLR
jgi:hypothetical protein